MQLLGKSRKILSHHEGHEEHEGFKMEYGTALTKIPNGSTGERTLVVEGWRFLPHSYAVVNQFQLLAMLDAPGLRLFHRDLPLYLPHWRPVRGLLPRTSEDALAGIPPPPTDAVQALYRIGFPYDLRPANAGRTVAFGTSELLWVDASMLAGPGSLSRQMAGSETLIVTPSQWSRKGFVRSGAPEERVAVVPHGVDPALHRPLAEAERQALRQKMGWEPYVVFLSVGTMKGNKGVRQMLKALAAVAEKYPDVRLALKGSDALYDSGRLVTEMADTLTRKERAAVLDRIFYLGEPLSFSAMARLYQAADVYLSPYLAEGFNIPALEAAACGLPVVCTQGGPTDDFAHERFFLGIQSRLARKQVSETQTNLFLVPDADHLVARMMRAVEDEALRVQAREELPAWVHQRFSWAAVTRQLLDAIFAGM